MKIDLAQIFNTKQTRNNKYKPKQSQASTRLGFQSLLNSKVHQKDRSFQNAFTYHIPKSNKNPMIDTIKHSNITNNKNSYFKPSSLTDSVNSHEARSTLGKTVTNKKIVRQTVESVTQRLYQPINCGKKNCQDIKLNEFYKKLKKDHCYNDGKFQKRNNRSLTENCELIKSNNSLLHEKLYQIHKSRQFKVKEKEIEQEKVRQQMNKPLNISNNQPYLKDYVKFYSRLDAEVHKKSQKLLYYSQNQNPSVSGSIFHPNTTSSKRSLVMASHPPKIVPKTQKNMIKGRGQMQKLNLSREDLSFCQSIKSNTQKNKYLKAKEEKIISRLCSLFIEDGYVKITPEAISELDDKQFEIIFPLLQNIEEGQQIDEDTLRNLIKQYYQGLAPVQKSLMRNLKSKLTERKQSPKKLSHKSLSKMSLSGIIKGGEYLQKLSNYI